MIQSTNIIEILLAKTELIIASVVIGVAEWVKWMTTDLTELIGTSVGIGVTKWVKTDLTE